MDRHDPELQEAIRAAYNAGLNHGVDNLAQSVLSGVLPPGFDDVVCDLTQPCETPSDAGMHSLCIMASTVINQHKIIDMMRADTWASANPTLASALTEAMDKADVTWTRWTGQAEAHTPPPHPPHPPHRTASHWIALETTGRTQG